MVERIGFRRAASGRRSGAKAAAGAQGTSYDGMIKLHDARRTSSHAARKWDSLMASTPEVISRLDRDREAIWQQFTNGALTANEATLALRTLDLEVGQGGATGATNGESFTYATIRSIGQGGRPAGRASMSPAGPRHQPFATEAGAGVDQTGA